MKSQILYEETDSYIFPIYPLKTAQKSTQEICCTCP
jgi:hypothetical protein